MGQVPRRRVGLVPAAYHEHPEVGAFDLAVLCVLATHANRLGACWPSQGTIATAAKLDRGTVNRVLAKLVGLGLVEKTSHPNRKIRSRMYRLVGHEALMEDFLSGLDDGLPNGSLEEAEKPAPATSDARILEPAVVGANTEHLEHSSKESLSQARDAAHGPACGDAGVVRDGPVVIDAGWVPGAADMAFAQECRPDLTPPDVALIGAKFALHYAGQALANPTAVFHRWILTERVAHHDHRDISRNHPAPFRRKDGNAGLAQRNSVAADDCLRRILARRGEHLSA
jgi:DNA-binding transcriptional ArsR family regulator